YLTSQRRLARTGGALRGRAARAAAATARAARIRRRAGYRGRGGEGDARFGAEGAGHRRAPEALRLPSAGNRGRDLVARSRAAPGLDRRAVQVGASGGVLRVRVPRRLQDGDQAARGGIRREVYD